MQYKNEFLQNISFPLGGIGTGCIGLAGNGELIDWEIFNRPNKNTRNGYSHFAVRAVTDDGVVAKVLQGDTYENLSGSYDGGSGHIGFGFGVHNNSLAGFPHFRNVTFEGNFPLCSLSFTDDTFPGAVRLTALNPMIPHNAFDSSLPAALFEWEIENTSDRPVEYTLAFSVCNPAAVSENREISTENATGIFFVNGEKQPDEIGYCDLCCLTDRTNGYTQESWYRGRWRDASTTFWNNFTAKEPLPARHCDTPGQHDHGSVASAVTVAPGERARVRFVLAWSVPVQYNYWKPYQDENGNHVTWKNYYATQFADSRQTAQYVLDRFDDLREQSLRFAEALNQSSLPDAARDAVSSNLSVLKTPTVLRLEDGSLWGWEGCNERTGSCEGSCQHVWNYAYALPYLFPELERSLRENTVKYALTEAGATTFRVPLPVGRKLGEFRSCVDGQMGEVIKCYREWKLSGDTEWLKKMAPSIFKMLDYARSPENPDAWDRDCDGVLEGRQHHTLDMELFGPNSWLQGFYLLALDCGARMAEALGRNEKAEEYRALYEKGKEWTAKNLFNGFYFCQNVDLTDRDVVARFGAEDTYWNEEAGQIKYQVAQGCIIDQMLADWHAGLIGLDPVFEEEQRKTALGNLYKNNFVPSMRSVANMWRNFAVNDEGGTVICSYPDGAPKPAIPIPYCEEVMTGFEYAAAGLLLQNGFSDEGLTVVSAIRDRYDGKKRNPWNEIECGSNYARSMASFALLPIYSGFTFDMTKSYLGFAPLSGEGTYLWSIKNTWGTVSVEQDRCTLSVYGEPLTLARFGIPGEAKTLSVDGTELPFAAQGDGIEFEEVKINHTLELMFK